MREPEPTPGIAPARALFRAPASGAERRFEVTTQYYNPIKSRIRMAFMTDAEIVLTAQQQYIAGVATIDPTGDVEPETWLPPAPCPGCEQPMCMCLENLTLYQTAGTPPMDAILLTEAASRNYVTWQGGAVPWSGCPGATPVKNRTWGSVKSLYR